MWKKQEGSGGRIKRHTALGEQGVRSDGPRWKDPPRTKGRDALGRQGFKSDKSDGGNKGNGEGGKERGVL